MSFLRYAVSVSIPNSRYSHCLQHFNDDADVVSLFNQMLHKKPTPRPIEFGEILGSLLKAKHYPTVVSLYQQMELNRVTPDFVTHNILINSLSQLGHVTFAFSVLTKILKRGYHPTVITFNTLIKALCLKGDLLKALQFHDNLVAKGFQLDYVSYGTLMDGLCKAGQTTAALQLLRRVDGKLVWGQNRTSMSMPSLRSLVIQAKFIQTIRRTPGAIETHISFKLFCTQTTQNPDSLCKRIEKLPKGESIASAFRSWMGDGFPVRGADVFHTINRLRKLNFNRRALEVMEWVIRERPYRPRELDYSYLVEFTTKLHGIPHGENLFTRVPIEFQNELLYNNLVIACLDKGVVRLSLEYMKRMRELGHPISHLVFNRLIILHSSPGRRKMIPGLLTQMKADKVTPHVSTYNILMKIEANEHNLENLMRFFDRMKRVQVEPNEISYCILATAHAVARLYTATEMYVEAVEKSMTGSNWSTLDVLLILYGYLGCRKDLERIWDIIKGLPFVRSKSYLLAIEAFGRIGELNRAEEIWSEMESIKGLKSVEQFNSMMTVYCKHGVLDKASRLYKNMKANGCKPNAITYRHLALGCLKSGKAEQALKTLELGMRQTLNKKVSNSTPWLETTLSIAEIFAEKGDVGNVEKLFEEFHKAKYCRYTFVYNTLIKAYVKAKIYSPNLLRRMILGGANPDAETYSLLKIAEQFRT